MRLLQLFGWTLERKLPPTSKYIIAGAFHTSNWDLLLLLLAGAALSLDVRWVAKHTAFRGPLGPVLRWLGGIPVDRRSRNGFVDQIAQLYRETDNLIIVIAPEGTRSRTEFWRSGFYYIALEAKIPIALGYGDFRTRRAGIGHWFMPTGDIEEDFAVIRGFFDGISGLRPENQGPVVIRPRAAVDDTRAG